MTIQLRKYTLNCARISLTLLIAGAPVVGLAQQIPGDPFDDPAFTNALPPLDQSVSVEDPKPVATPPIDLAVEQKNEIELAAPLPSLSTLENAIPATTALEASERAPDIRYRLKIAGLEEVGLENRFRDLSALLDKGSKAANAAQVTARADEDVQLAERLLRSEGYFDGLVTALVGPLPDASGQLPVLITATPGLRYRLGTVTLIGPTPATEPLVRSALALLPDQPIVAADIQTAEARVALRLPEQGYPFVNVGDRDILLDDATQRGDYNLPVETGPKTRYSGFRLAGDPVFDEKHIAIFPRFKPGEIYDSRQVDDMRRALVATSLFSSVAVTPQRTGVVAPDGTETVELLVQQNRGPQRSLAGSAGFSTGEGVKLQGSWTHRNLFPPEGALIVTAIAGTKEQSLNTSFRRSNAGKRDRALLISALASRQRFEAYNAESFALSSSLSRNSTPIWQKRWTWSVGGELLATRETRFDTTNADRARSVYFIAALPLSIGYDLSNSLLDPTKGVRLTARVSPEAQQRANGGFDSYGRTLFEASGYFGVSDSIVLAARARVGSIVGAPRDDIAPSRRLYSGGGGSVRGFGYQQLGPKDIDDKPIGGRSLTEFAAEARYRFGDYGIVTFLDAGRVGESSSPSIAGMRYGAGIGGRYYTNFGPLRLDVATPLKRRKGESLVALYLSIGQAF